MLVLAAIIITVLGWPAIILANVVPDPVLVEYIGNSLWRIVASNGMIYTVSGATLYAALRRYFKMIKG